MKYKMHYIGGGEAVKDGGEWEVKETEKMITFTCIKEPFFSLCCGTILRTRKDNK